MAKEKTRSQILREEGLLSEWLGVPGAEKVLNIVTQKKEEANMLSFEDPATGTDKLSEIQNGLIELAKKLTSMEMEIYSRLTWLQNMSEHTNTQVTAMYQAKNTPNPGPQPAHHPAPPTTPPQPVDKSKYANALDTTKKFFEFVKSKHPDWGADHAISYRNAKNNGMTLLRQIKAGGNIDIEKPEEFLEVLKAEPWLKFFPQTESFWMI